MNTRVITLCLAILGAAVFVPSAHAQRHSSFGSASAARFRTRHMHRYLGGAYAPYYYSDYDSDPGYVEAPPPPVFVAAAQPTASSPNPAPSEVLELSGDHWVRLTNYGESTTSGLLSQPEPDRTLPVAPGISTVAPRRAATAEPSAPLPPAVLVFRDGHQEQLGKYTIIGRTIYTSADYWTTGSWTKRVQITELDVPATLKLNQDHGARFALPTGPNEVMIRP